MRSVLMLVLTLAAVPAWSGTARQLDQADLVAFLAKQRECCIVDVRSESARKRQPIPFAVEFRDNVTVKAGGTALVVADGDAAALAAARTLARRSAGDAIAVKGGYATWKTLRQPDAAETAAPAFTIPHNTCEQGSSLQEYK